jgi:hypothetical protein
MMKVETEDRAMKNFLGWFNFVIQLFSWEKEKFIEFSDFDLNKNRRAFEYIEKCIIIFEKLDNNFFKNKKNLKKTDEAFDLAMKKIQNEK